VRITPKTALTLTIAAAVFAALLPSLAQAQDDPDEAPLGDVARSLRQKKATPQEVIDNDNLDKVMDEVQSHRLTGASLLYSIDGGGKNFQVSSPDVTCSLSFTANTKALLATQYVQLDLPATELPKLEGPANIAGDSLQVSVYNGTDWHVSEVDVVLTLVKVAETPAVPADDSSGKPSTAVTDAGTVQVPLQAPIRDNASPKRPDATFIYKMRAASPPASVTVFSAPLDVEIAPGQEWHWAIVQAKGYPPQRTMLPDPLQAQAARPAASLVQVSAQTSRATPLTPAATTPDSAAH
jgi:hypothetical protein